MFLIGIRSMLSSAMMVAPGRSLAGIRVIFLRLCNATLLEIFSRFFEHVSRNRFVVPVSFFFGCGAGVTLSGAYSAVPGSGLRFFLFFPQSSNALICFTHH